MVVSHSALNDRFLACLTLLNTSNWEIAKVEVVVVSTSSVWYLMFSTSITQHSSGSLAEMTSQMNTLCETCLCARFLLLVLNALHHYLEGWSNVLLECQQSVSSL